MLSTADNKIYSIQFDKNDTTSWWKNFSHFIKLSLETVMGDIVYHLQIVMQFAFWRNPNTSSYHSMNPSNHRRHLQWKFYISLVYGLVRYGTAVTWINIYVFVTYLLFHRVPTNHYDLQSIIEDLFLIHILFIYAY